MALCMRLSFLWRSRKLELALLLLGVLLRVAAALTLNPLWGYDVDGHYQYAEWFAHNAKVPPLTEFFQAFHPPLYYAMGGLIIKAGGHIQQVRILSLVFGGGRLALLWAGLELYLPGRRMARLVAMALAAILPAALFMDVSIGAEALQSFLATLALLLAPLALRAKGRERWYRALGLGLVLGLSLLTKISVLAVLFAVGVSALGESLLPRSGTPADRLRRAAPFAASLALALAIVAPLLVRNVRAVGKPFLTSFDTFQAKDQDSVKDRPLLDRRSLGYVFLGSLEIYKRPYWPTAIQPNPRFFPVLMASAFVDYHGYGLAPRRPAQPDDIMAVTPVRHALLLPSCLSLVGGTLIASTLLGCWLACAYALWKRRQVVMLPLLLAPPLALLGLLHFTIAHPFDILGVIKATYVQFGFAPAYGLFGLAVDELWHRGRKGRVLAWIGLGGLALVAFYTFFCRVLIR